MKKTSLALCISLLAANAHAVDATRQWGVTTDIFFRMYDDNGPIIDAIGSPGDVTLDTNCDGGYTAAANTYTNLGEGRFKITPSAVEMRNKSLCFRVAVDMGGGQIFTHGLIVETYGCSPGRSIHSSGMVHCGAVASATETTIQFDASASTEHNFYQHHFVQELPNGQQRVIRSYDGNTRVAILSSPWHIIPGNGAVYQVPQGNLAGIFGVEIEPQGSISFQCILQVLAAGMIGRTQVESPEITYFTPNGAGERATVTQSGNDRIASLLSCLETF